MKLKTCRNCKQDKEITEYSVLTRLRKEVKYQCDCRSCRSLKRRENSRKTKALAIEYKGGKCVDCSQVVHQAAFEFHHLDPSTKEKDPTHFLNDRVGLSESALEELDKCVLLCANCHRIRHFSDLI